MGRLTELPNIGPELERQLRAAGIDTPEKLRTKGSREARLARQAEAPGASCHRLCTLEGALRRWRWHDLPPEAKRERRGFYAARKGEA